MDDRNDATGLGGSMSVTKVIGTTPGNEGREGSVSLMSDLKYNGANFTEASAGSLSGFSQSDLHAGFQKSKPSGPIGDEYVGPQQVDNGDTHQGDLYGRGGFVDRNALYDR